MTRIIDDSNWQQIVELDRQAGRNRGILPRKSKIGDLKYATVFAEQIPLIPESEWSDRIDEMTAKKLWIGDRVAAAGGDNADDHYQNGLGYCWAYSLCQAVEANRIVSGQSFELLAPESLGEDVGWRNEGNYMDSALEYAAENGIARRKFVPQHVIRPSKFDPQWKEDRRNFVPSEWWDIGSKDTWSEVVTALLLGHGCYVGYDWAGHAVFLDRLVKDGRRIGVHTPNTHGQGEDWTLFGNKAIPGYGSFILRRGTFQPTPTPTR